MKSDHAKCLMFLEIKFDSLPHQCLFMLLACRSSYDPKLHVFTSTPFQKITRQHRMHDRKMYFANNKVIECDLNQLQTKVSYHKRRLRCPVIFITNLSTYSGVIKGQGEGTTKGRKQRKLFSRRKSWLAMFKHQINSSKVSLCCFVVCVGGEIKGFVIKKRLLIQPDFIDVQAINSCIYKLISWGNQKYKNNINNHCLSTPKTPLLI